MKANKFLLLVLFSSLLLIPSLFNSCADDEYEPFNEVLVIASEIVVKDDGTAFWVKRNGSSTWEMMYTEIDNFNYEIGYEYIVEVRVNKIKDPGPDQSSHKYTLVKIISKEKKDSNVNT